MSFRIFMFRVRFEFRSLCVVIFMGMWVRYLGFERGGGWVFRFSGLREGIVEGLDF